MAQDHVSPDAMLTAKETKRLAHPARPLAIQAINTAGAEMDSPILVSGSPRSISSDASNWVMTMPTYPVLLEALETEHKVNRHQASQIDALQDKIDTLQTCLDDSHHQINSLEEALHLAHAEHSMVEHEKNRLVAHIEQLESQLAQQRRDMVSPASDISLQAPRRFDSQQRLGPQIDIPELISRHSSSMDISQLQQASLILDHEITARQSPHRPLRHRASFIPPSYPPLSMASSRNSSFMLAGTYADHNPAGSPPHDFVELDATKGTNIAELEGAPAAHDRHSHRHHGRRRTPTPTQLGRLTDRFKRRPSKFALPALPVLGMSVGSENK